MITCETVQERLAEIGAEALREDVELARHTAGCAACSAFLEDIRQLDAALAALPEADAPDELVAATLEKVRQAEVPHGKPQGFSVRRPQIAAALAACVVLAASVGLTMTYLQSSDGIQYFKVATEAPSPSVSRSEEQLAEAAPAQVPLENAGERDNRMTHSSLTDGLKAQFGLADEGQTRVATEPVSGLVAPQEMVEAEEEVVALADDAEVRRQKKGEKGLSGQGAYRNEAVGQAEDGRLGREADLMARLLMPGGPAEEDVAMRDQLRSSEVVANGRLEASKKNTAKAKADQDLAMRESQQQVPGDVVGGVATGETEALAENNRLADERVRALASEPEVFKQSLDSLAKVGDDKNLAGEAGAQRGAGSRSDSLGFTDGPQASNEPQAVLEVGELPAAASPAPSLREFSQVRALGFLQDLETLEGLSFQDPICYWANSYIPGDPEMRLLAAQLPQQDRTQIEAAVQRVEQPFDAPKDAAVALFLQADKTAVEGPARLRLQVGLKGAERLGGQRPDMNLALVLDLRDLQDPEAAMRFRALVTALERARRPGDRFSLVVAGPDGGQLLAPEDFLHGPISLAMTRLFAGGSPADAQAMDLLPAMALASETLRAGDDPNAVLGSSLLLLASNADLAAELPALGALAHENAISGLALSVVRMGAGGDLAALDRLVAAGQGQRRQLERASDAEALVDRELHAASRAVARALRLRIRLAPGVQLIDVLGSARLDELQSDQVREAEVAVDRRLARNLGIEADRGEDEEGIQIVIPSFYAGDDHVILLDLVTEGPGPLAEVTLRYKDVISQQNAVARASLSLAAGGELSDPLAQNVLKNRLAYELSQGLRQAARDVAADRLEAAKDEIVGLIELIRGLRFQVAGWSADADLIADEALLEDYLAALDAASGTGPRLREQLAGSLTYAAHLKLQKTAPLGWEE